MVNFLSRGGWNRTALIHRDMPQPGEVGRLYSPKFHRTRPRQTSHAAWLLVRAATQTGLVPEFPPGALSF
jgi:hypothetical protein